MLKIGLTGGIGSGKSMACQYFRNLGVTVIDSDEVAKALTTPKHPAIWEALTAHLDASFFDEQGHLNRAKLRAHIFDHPEEKKWLEALLHPAIAIESHRQADKASGPYVILCIPLLTELHLQDTVNEVWVVDCSPELQIARTLARDPLCTPATAQKILAQQASREARLAIADAIISNESSLEALEKNVINQHNQYLHQHRLL